MVTRGTTVSVRKGPGRDRIRFISENVGKERYVIPSDALPLLRAGRLDKRLFDITELTSLHSGTDLPLLVAYGKGSVTAARGAISAGSARVTRDIPAVGTLAVRADLTGRASIWSALTSGTPQSLSLRPGVQKVWLDGKRKVSDDVSGPQIGAPAAWAAGYDGTGVTVGVLDTGIDATHPDLAGKIVATQNFTDTPSTDDTVGHGTHVASIIAGTGAASNGRYKGIAPGAKLLIGKVCGTEECDDSAILAGMAWAAPQASVINMSLGGSDTPGTDPLEQAVDDLTAQYGTLFVIAAGNDGGTGTVGSPSTADAALSVGAVDADNQVADFSSRGPRVGDYALKPDITAPGVNIVAAKAANGVIGDPAPVDGYVTLSGTSMATPHVAGAAAILTQEHPAWSSALRKDTLMGAAQPTAGTGVFDQGAGRVDVAREITQTVAAEEGSLSFGLQAWPHGDDKPITKTVTYRNSGTAAADLTLTGPGGAFTVADTHLTVPAGGTATTTVTADTSGNTPDGLLGGYLTATTASGVRVETPVGVDKEVESYDVTVNTTGLDGAPNTDHLVALLNLDTFQEYDAWQPQGSEILRVPKGRYGVFAYVFGDADGSSIFLTDTQLTVDHTLTVDADARKAGKVVLTAPQPGAAALIADVNATWTLADDASFSSSLVASDFGALYAGSLSDVSEPFFEAAAGGSFDDGSPRNSAYAVDLAYASPGRMFHGLIKSPKVADLATIHASYAAGATGAEGAAGKFAGGVGWAVFRTFDLPFHRTEYVSTGTSWQSELDQQLPATGDDFPTTLAVTLHSQTYQAGHAYTQQWNRAVFGPTVAEPDWEGDYLTRQGDHLVADVPLFGDGNGWPGFSATDTSAVSLYRGGTKLGDGAEYDLPAATATYRLKASATRSAPFTLSTSVSGVWTFKSGHVAGDAYKRLPLATVTFTPPLDDQNSAPGGRLFTIPMSVRHQPGATAVPLRSVRVDTSSDDGKTWRPAVVLGGGDHRVAVLTNPRSGFVSLRVTATDTAGQTLSETVIRAYVIR